MEIVQMGWKAPYTYLNINTIKQNVKKCKFV